MKYIDRNESECDDKYGVPDISCQIATVIWGQNIQYSVDKGKKNEYNLCVSINDSYDAEDLGQGFEGMALNSLKRGVAVGVTKWVLDIPLADGVYYIFMYNDGLHAKGFAKIAKRLGFRKSMVSTAGFMVVIRNGKPCRWGTRWVILKACFNDRVEETLSYLEDFYYTTKYKIRKKQNESNKPSD